MLNNLIPFQIISKTVSNGSLTELLQYSVMSNYWSVGNKMPYHLVGMDASGSCIDERNQSINQSKCPFIETPFQDDYPHIADYLRSQQYGQPKPLTKQPKLMVPIQDAVLRNIHLHQCQQETTR